MRYRYLVSYIYNKEDRTFGCNTMKHALDIIKSLNVSDVRIYDYQLKKFRSINE